MIVNGSPLIAPILSTPEDGLFSESSKHTLRGSKPHAHLSENEFRQMYDIDRTVKQICAQEYRRVALQFPDELLMNSTRVYSLILAGINKSSQHGNAQSIFGLEKKVFILADTSYAACCVDEIAAQHVAADIVVHYGRSCLSPTSHLPVIYVFTTNPMDLQAAVLKFCDVYSEKSTKVLLVADVTYQSHTVPLFSALKACGYRHIFASGLIHFPGSLLPNRTLPPEIVSGEDLRSWSIFHLSEPLPSLQLILSSRVSTLHYFDPKQNIVQSAVTSTLLRRRYAVLSHAKTARVIGILVNTLNIKHHLPMISHIKNKIRNAGRKSYLVVVGKVNVEKVANFAEIEVWVGVGCWEQGVVGSTDSRGWYRPVITPWELGVALGSREWDGSWIADFTEVLRCEGDQTCNKKVSPHLGGDEDNLDDEDAPPEYDLRTGRYISSVRTIREDHKNPDCIDLPSINSRSKFEMQPNSITTTSGRKSEIFQAGGVSSPGADFLREKRTWHGLGSEYTTTGNEKTNRRVGALVEEGRSGHASGYVVADSVKR